MDQKPTPFSETIGARNEHPYNLCSFHLYLCKQRCLTSAMTIKTNRSQDVFACYLSTIFPSNGQVSGPRICANDRLVHSQPLLASKPTHQFPSSASKIRYPPPPGLFVTTNLPFLPTNHNRRWNCALRTQSDFSEQHRRPESYLRQWSQHAKVQHV